jgi:lysophospholipase L1-like esterase
MIPQNSDPLPARSGHPQRFGSLLGSLLLLLVSVAVAFVAVEGFFRLAPGALPLEVQQRLGRDQAGIFHPYIGHLHTPYHTGMIAGRDFAATHHTDAYGFRNSWPWPAQAEIVALGDSLTFGYGVDDAATWPALLAQTFPYRRVLNLGLIGASPQQYLRVYETFGRGLRPRLVIVGLFLGNDFSDARLFEQWLASGTDEHYLAWRNFDRGSLLSSFFNRHSYVYVLLAHAYQVYQDWQVSEPLALELTPGTRVQLQSSHFVAHTAYATPEQPPFQYVLRTLSRLATLAREQQAHVLIVFQPAKEQVYLPLLGQAVTDPGAELRTALDAEGIPFLDLQPAFRRHAEAREQLFFEWDGHPNARGYRLIAQEIAAHLSRNAATYGFDPGENLPGMLAPQEQSR